MPGVPLDEREMLIESQPKVFYFTDHYRDYPMVLIRLSKAKRAIVEPLLRRHWRDAGLEEGGAGIRQDRDLSRHCERSEAIHRADKASMDCFVASLPAQTLRAVAAMQHCAPP